jgi:ATPase subunit of ABC transporter with duplicated ATPase domains
MNTTTNPPEAARALQLAEQAYETAVAVEIDSPEMFQMAGSELQAIKAKAKQIEDLRLSLTRPLDESKKRIMDLFRGPLSRLEEAEGLIRKGMLTFQQAEREKAERARREAEEQSRRERAEQERQRREAQAAERRAREEADAARAAGDAAAAEAAEAARQEAAVAAEHATAEIELAEIAPVAIAVFEQPKAVGISTRQNWKAEVTDLKSLVIAAGKAAEAGDTTLLGYLEPNTKALGQVAKALKGQARIPGVRVYAEEGLAVRAA